MDPSNRPVSDVSADTKNHGEFQKRHAYQVHISRNGGHIHAFCLNLFKFAEFRKQVVFSPDTSAAIQSLSVHYLWIDKDCIAAEVFGEWWPKTCFLFKFHTNFISADTFETGLLLLLFIRN